MHHKKTIYLFLRTLLLAIATCVLVSPPSLVCAQDYTLLTFENLVPWSIETQRGIFPDIVREIERRLGTNRRISSMPWQRALVESRTKNNVIIFPFTRSAEREEQFTWIADVMPYSQVFVTPHCELQPLTLDKARKLDQILAHFKAPPYLFLERQGFKNLHPVPHDNTLIIKMLEADRAEAWFAVPELARYAARGTALEGKLCFGPQVQQEYRLYIAASKNIPVGVVSAYRRAYSDMVADGTVARIIRDYQ